MGQVTQQLFGLDNPADIHFGNVSADESDDENREDEIKKLLEEGLSNETFEYDSDSGSSHQGSKISNHNTCSFLSNKDSSFRSTNGGNNGIEHEQDGLFKIPTTNGNNGINGKHVDIKMLPNTLLEDEDGSLRSVPLNSKQRSTDQIIKSNGGYSNNGDMGKLLKTTLGGKELGSMFQSQKNPNRENEEIEVRNPTISLLHKDHCPQTETHGLERSWLSSENNAAELKTLCDLRERQLQRTEETIATLQKDKRALNHQIGLLKSEMIQTRSQQDEAEKYAQLKDEEVQYMKNQIREAIDEYELARRNEAIAKEENVKLQSEIDKLQQEVRLLSSLGSSVQQTEVNDVVRQLREKHALDMASWKRAFNELEAENRAYKRTQQLLNEESIIISKANVQTQTEYMIEEEIERREKELAAQEFEDEFGGISDEFVEDLKDLNEREIVKRVRKEWKIESEKLRNYYLSEIKIYKQNLVSLPRELYTMWEQMQADLGLNKPLPIKPLSKTIGTETEEIYARANLRDQSTSFEIIRFSPENSSPSKSFREESVQVNFAAVMSNTDRVDVIENNRDTTSVSRKSSVLDEKEMSSVICQTDETLETYMVLANMIDSWAVEVATCKQRADLAEVRSQEAEDELKKLNKKFKSLQKMAGACRKEWRKQEEALRKKNGDMKAHYVEMLKKLNDKLGLIDQQ